jgi:5-formyltetrahydrofolate cyclo-ligase
MEKPATITEKEILKKQIRSRMLYHRRQTSPEEILAKSRDIRKHLESMEEYQQAQRIVFYVSLPKEVDTHEIIQATLKKGKQVAVPVTDRWGRNLVLSELKDFKAELARSTYGVLEPKPQFYRYFEVKNIDLVIMPGVAFDRRGHRLGFGGGYYDSFLKKVPATVPRIALAFDFQIMEELPRDIWDKKVHQIITEKEIILCK